MGKKSDNFIEFGVTGLPVYSGRVYDEPLGSKLGQDRWREVVREMMANDASIQALLFVIQMVARQVEWKIVPFEDTPDDEEQAQFIRECMFEDMQQTWQDTVAEILSFIPWGWSWHEIVYKRRGGLSTDKTKNSRFSDGLIGWRKWAIRGQESLYEWQMDEWDEVEALVQMPAPDFEIRTIPFEKSLHFRTTSHRQNPEGRSILRGAYRSWYFKANIENIEGIGIERDLAGLPIIYCPPEILKESATAEQKQLLSYLQGLVTKIRRDEEEGVIFPMSHDTYGHKEYELQLLSSGGKRQFDTSGIIDRYDQRMLMSAMADFLLLGSKDVGSYALGETKFRTFLKAIKTWLDAICDTVNRYAIPRLLHLNGKSSERSPYLKSGSLDDINLADLGTYVGILTKAGITFNGEEQNYLKERANIPVDATTSPEEEEGGGTLPGKQVDSEDPKQTNGSSDSGSGGKEKP